MKARKYTKETILSLDVADRGFDKFEIGDTISVGQRIKEGDKERIQFFEGDVIAIKHSGITQTFTVRRIGANGVSVERIFPLFSPLIDSIKFVRHGRIRRAKLYYMRNRIGKAARVAEKVLTKEQKQRAQENRVEQ
jgi:large subunit ribosomal protein L19